MENYTSLSSWISAIEIALRNYPTQFSDIITAAAVPESTINNPYERADVRLIAKAWDIAIERTGEENLGILAAPACHPTHWHALGLAMLCSTSVRDALNRVAQFQAILTNVVDMHCYNTKGHLRFKMTTRLPVSEIGIGVVDFGFAGLLSVCRSIFPGDITPSRVYLQRPKPSNPEPFYHFYGTEVMFDCDCHLIEIPDAIADRRLDHSDPRLAAHQDQLAADYIDRVVENSTALKTREKIQDALSIGEPNQQKIATQLGLSSRQLQRLLQKEDTSFKNIIKSVRMDLAEQQLQLKQCSITDIALQLGFADHSNFTRAFKTWFGCTPSEYRVQH